MLELRNLSYSLSGQKVLDETTYAFPQAGLVCIMGPSGSGKTSLLQLIAGFDTNFSGEIILDNLNLSTLDDRERCLYRARHLGFIFQDFCLIKRYTALQNVMLACECSAQPERAQAQAQELLEGFGLGDKVSRRVGFLSGGEKQRVAIARALMGTPSLILADEPTASLDGRAARDIMRHLKCCAQTHLVIVVTHDQALAAFADELLSLQQGKLVVTPRSEKDNDTKSRLRAQQSQHSEKKYAYQTMPVSKSSGRQSASDSETFCQPSSVVSSVSDDYGVPSNEKISPPLCSIKRAWTNVALHKTRLVVVSLLMSLGVLAVLLCVSAGNISDQAIQQFKQQNPVYSAGFIKNTDQLLDGDKLLKQDDRISNIYPQYELDNVDIQVGEQKQTLTNKVPGPEANQTLSYGHFPRQDEREIALSPSLAKKFSSNIQNLIGKGCTIRVKDKTYEVSICGIYNAGYDDYFVSSGVERDMYRGHEDDSVYSFSYEVGDFNQIVSVSEWLKEQGFQPQDAAEQVGHFQETFGNLEKLFMGISFLIACVALFLCTLLLISLQKTRIREVGLWAVLGFPRVYRVAIIQSETAFLALLSAVVTLVLFGAAVLLSHLINFSLVVSVESLVLADLAAFVATMIVGILTSWRMLNTLPAKALRL